MALPIPFGIALILAAVFLPKKRAIWPSILVPIAVIPIAISYILLSGASDDKLAWSFMYAKTIFYGLIPFSIVAAAIVWWRNHDAHK